VAFASVLIGLAAEAFLMALAAARGYAFGSTLSQVGAALAFGVLGALLWGSTLYVIKTNLRKKHPD
jgi:hypothetical protein